MQQEVNSFFENIDKFLKKQRKQQQRGLNNYNILTTVLKKSDEVRLHSRMIFSLLNINGEHYQGSLFLELFLETIKIKGFQLDCNNSVTYKEYKNIDLYITDQNKHIIIENKIYAIDQHNQINKYVKIINNENDNKIESDDLLVIYLTLNRISPTKSSLGDMTINGSYLEKDGVKIARYKSIHYKNEIINWLDKCRYEVQNLTNLNMSIKQYLDVVKMINNSYKEKIMNLSDYLKSDISTFKLALEVNKSLPAAREEIVNDFFNKVVNILQEKLGDEWVVKTSGEIAKKYNYGLSVYKREWAEDKHKYLYFSSEFERDNMQESILGIIRSDVQINIKEDILQNFTDEFSSVKTSLKTSLSWLHWEFYPRDHGDFSEYIVLNSHSIEDYVEKMWQLIGVFELKSGLLSRINSKLNINA